MESTANHAIAGFRVFCGTQRSGNCWGFDRQVCGPNHKLAGGKYRPSFPLRTSFTLHNKNLVSEI